VRNKRHYDVYTIVMGHAKKTDKMTNSIFHYTDSLEKLSKILKDKAFKVSYCKEELIYSLGNPYNGGICYSYAIPMISFCDIPPTYKTTYGDFGIGLKLSWAIENRMNPVLYRFQQPLFFDYPGTFLQA